MIPIWWIDIRQHHSSHFAYEGLVWVMCEMLICQLKLVSSSRFIALHRHVSLSLSTHTRTLTSSLQNTQNTRTPQIPPGQTQSALTHRILMLALDDDTVVTFDSLSHLNIRTARNEKFASAQTRSQSATDFTKRKVRTTKRSIQTFCYRVSRTGKTSLPHQTLTQTTGFDSTELRSPLC